MDKIFSYLGNIRFADVVDILMVAYIIYKLMILIKQTRAEQLIKGILAIMGISILTKALNLYTMQWILNKFLVYGMLSLLVVFQPELRRALEYIGRSHFLSKPIAEVEDETISKVTHEIVTAVASLARQKIGALIVIEKDTGLNEIIETGTVLDAEISMEILINIFIPNTPLHDGAVVIREGKIKAAACFLPLTDNKTLSKELGTRHRAALGITEKSDCVAIVVSEETGGISVAENGQLSRYVDEKTLEMKLGNMFKSEETGIFSWFRRV